MGETKKPVKETVPFAGFFLIMAAQMRRSSQVNKSKREE